MYKDIQEYTEEQWDNLYCADESLYTDYELERYERIEK